MGKQTGQASFAAVSISLGLLWIILSLLCSSFIGVTSETPKKKRGISKGTFLPPPNLLLTITKTGKPL